MPEMRRVLKPSDQYGKLYVGELKDYLPTLGEPVTVIDSDGEEFRTHMHRTMYRIDGLTLLIRKHDAKTGQAFHIAVSPDKPQVVRVLFIPDPHGEPINVEDQDLRDEEIDDALRTNRLRLEGKGIVSTASQPALVRQRQGQTRIRKLTLDNYGMRCAVCDIADADFLVASHIVGWAEAPEHRGDLSNVICLCRIHDALFEAGYWSLGNGLEILPKKFVTSSIILQLLADMTFFRTPWQFPPAPRFVKRHRERTGFEA